MAGATEEAVTDSRQTWERPSAFYRREFKWLFYILVLGFFLWSGWGLRVPAERVIAGFGGMFGVLSEMVPPNTSPRRLNLLYNGILESIAMSVVATVIGVLLSIPIAFMAADNIVPKPIYFVGRGFIIASRSLHELIVAIIAVKAFGIGAFAGVFTLVFGTVGFYSKLLAEDIEDIDSTQVDAVQATGAGSIQTMVFAVLPQVLPRIIGLTVYRWDINIRHSTVVGIVGAGGIGATLMNSFNTYELDFSLTIVIAIVTIVLLGEATSAAIRGRIN